MIIFIKYILGGASVNYHMIAPMSKGLFNRAISQSGTLMNVWADPPRPGLAKMRAIRLADKMGCPIIDTNYEKIISCLRKVDAKKITSGMFDFFVSDAVDFKMTSHKFPLGTFSLKEVDYDPMIPFPPVIEYSHEAEEELFISDFRYKKHSFDIPWMVGLTSDEGLSKTAGVCSHLNEKFCC